MLRRSPLKRATPLRSGVQLGRQGITRRPTRRLAVSRQVFYDVKPAVWARDHGQCVICSGRASEYHHRQPRQMGGSSRSDTIHSPAAILLLCRADHARCESERAWAEANGYLVRRGVTTPAEVPVLYRGEWCLLTDAGTVLFVAVPSDPGPVAP